MNVKEIRRENLRMLAKALGGITALARQLNKDQAQLSHLIGRSPVKNIGDKLAAYIEDNFRKPSGWLDVFHEDIFFQQRHQFGFLPHIPLIHWTQIKRWIKYKDVLTENHKKIPVKILTHAKAFALQIESDDMSCKLGTSFQPGTIIIVNPTKHPKNGSYVLVEENENYIFRQLLIDTQKFYLRPLNQKYSISILSHLSKICGTVQQVLVEID